MHRGAGAGGAKKREKRHSDRRRLSNGTSRAKERLARSGLTHNNTARSDQRRERKEARPPVSPGVFLAPFSVRLHRVRSGSKAERSGMSPVS